MISESVLLVQRAEDGFSHEISQGSIGIRLKARDLELEKGKIRTGDFGYT